MADEANKAEPNQPEPEPDPEPDDPNLITTESAQGKP
jgi:hypothetical protein